MTRVLAAELALFNIQVNSVAPAMVKTDFSKAFWSNEEIYNLVIVSTTGMVVHRGTLELVDSQTLYRKFFVTSGGILTALIGGNTEADVVLWRTDRLLGGET